MSTSIKRKAIILAGGTGSRLMPCTSVISKQLLPIFDKPMIYYPLSTIMLSGIRDVLIITTPRDMPLFTGLLGDGAKWGLNISYEVQVQPRGIADAFLVGKKFIDGSPCALILGDNLFHGSGMGRLMTRAASRGAGASVFAFHVSDPQRFGVVNFDENRRAISIEEKPQVPSSNYALTGLYFYDNRVCDFATELAPSQRGELEITDLNNKYLESGELSVEIMGRGFAWLDTGTHESLNEASGFISTVQRQQDIQIGCPEEIAFNNGWISASQVERLARDLGKTAYAEYLLRLAREAQ